MLHPQEHASMSEPETHTHEHTHTRRKGRARGCLELLSITLGIIVCLITILQFMGIHTLPGVSLNLPFFTTSRPCGVIEGGSDLLADPATNQSFEMYSCNRQDRLIMQGDGNLVLYNVQTDASYPLWASNTSDAYGAHFAVQSDGNLVVYNYADAVLWTTHTDGNYGAYLRVQDDGNLVLYSSTDQVLWASNTSDL
jgi:hypothetical protein